jgi:hypothetical protein
MTTIACQPRPAVIALAKWSVSLNVCCAMMLACLPAVNAHGQEEQEPETVYPAMEAPPDYVGEQNERVRQACISAGTCDSTFVPNGGGRQISVPRVDPCFIAQNAMRPCGSVQQNPPRPVAAVAPDVAAVDPNMVGTWDLNRPVGRWVLEVLRDGTYKFHSEAADGAVANAGAFSASNGHWWLRATNGYTDGGTYIFQPPDIWLATGRLGTGAWRQRSGSTASILWVMGALIVLFVVWKVSGSRKVAAVAKAPSVS